MKAGGLGSPTTSSTGGAAPTPGKRFTRSIGSSDPSDGRGRARGDGKLVLLFAVLLLGVLWRVAPGPPLYDALPAPAENYRFLQPPPGVTSAPPTTVDKDVPVENGETPTLAEATDEQPPQAQLIAEANAFAVPPGARSIHLHIGAVPPPSILPRDGDLDGNVYLFQVTAGGKPVDLRPGALVTIVLRGLPGLGAAHIETFDGSAWHVVASTPVGYADTYAGNVAHLGLAALVARAPGQRGGGGGGLPSWVVALVAALALGAATAGLVLSLRR